MTLVRYYCISKDITYTQRQNCWQNYTNIKKISNENGIYLGDAVKQPPFPHFQCWWIFFCSHMLSNVSDVNIEVGGRGARGEMGRDGGTFGWVFQHTIFPSK